MALAQALSRPQGRVRMWRQWAGLLGVVVCLSVLGGGLSYAYARYHESLAAEFQRQWELQLSSWARALEASLKEYHIVFDELIDRTQLASAFAADDTKALVAAEVLIAAEGPNVLTARALKPEGHRRDYDTDPPLTYAALDMLRRSASSGSVPPPEVHGAKQRHVTVLYRFADSERLLGHLVLSLDLAFLTKALAELPVSIGHLELQQSVGVGKPLTVAHVGDQGFARAAALATVDVADTRWQLAYWHPTPPQPFSPLANPLIVAAAAGLATLLVGVAVVLWRARLVSAKPVKASAKPQGAGEESIAPAVKAAAAWAAAEPAVAGMEVVEQDQATSASVELPASLFHAQDIRGSVEEVLTSPVTQALGRALGSLVQEQGQDSVVVGRDGRLSSPELSQALVAGLVASGCSVIDIGRVPTPVVYFALEYLSIGTGVMVTGSHWPAHVNGLKIVLNGEPLFGEELAALSGRADSGETTGTPGSIQPMDLVDEYIRCVAEDIPVALGNAFKLVIDAGNGVVGELAPKLYRALGHEVVELHCDVDGSFPNHPPDPTRPDCLSGLISAVSENSADLGFAFDGDGDRIVIVDDKGSIVWPERQMMLYARDVLSRNAGAAVVFDVNCSTHLAKVIQKMGGRPVMWKTGRAFMRQKMIEENAPVAGELSGHILFRERWNGFDDALYAGARMLEILLGFTKSPSEVFAKLPGGVATPEVYVETTAERASSLVQQVVGRLEADGAEITTIDGVRVEYRDGWGIVRESQSRAALALRFEGENQQALERIQNVFRRALLEVEPGLSLPF